MSLRRSLLLLLVLGLLATACGAEDPAETTEEATEAPADDAPAEDAATDDAATDDAATEGGAPDAAATEAGASEAAAACDPAQLPLVAEGTLTVATGEPAFEPWVVGDAPESGEGFEAAVVYEVAERLGLAPEDVAWVRTGFDQAIAPGPKDYDFNIQQYSINDERDEVVDFSRPYYVSEQAIIAAEGSEVASATSIEELAQFRLGAAIGTTSLDYVEQVIQPAEPAQVYDDNAAAKAAFDAGQVDGIVFDLPTAHYITAVEIPDATIVGVLPRVEEDADALGMLFEDGSELVPCVDAALDAMEADGTLEALEEEWLQLGGDIPTLEG